MSDLIVVVVLSIITVALAAFVLAPRLASRRVVFDVTPDAPKAFGADMSWLAVRTADTDAVMAAIGLGSGENANWNTGIGTVYDRRLSDGYVYVSPTVKGWTFIVGEPLPHPVGRAFLDKMTPLLARLSAEFNEVQYFAAFPGIDYFGWARLHRGRLVRAFAIGDDGIIWDRGRLTPEEKALGLKLFDLRGIKGRKGDAGGAIILYPTEEQVLRLAHAWSIDPSRLGSFAATPGVGRIAAVPSNWRAELVKKAAA